MAVLQGIPLDPPTLAAMNEEERKFWDDFLSEASALLNQLKNSGSSQPFQPTESLRAKHQTALSKYEGEKYCQMRQLKEFFAF